MYKKRILGYALLGILLLTGTSFLRNDSNNSHDFIENDIDNVSKTHTSELISNKLSGRSPEFYFDKDFYGKNNEMLVPFDISNSNLIVNSKYDKNSLLVKCENKDIRNIFNELKGNGVSGYQHVLDTGNDSSWFKLFLENINSNDALNYFRNICKKDAVFDLNYAVDGTNINKSEKESFTVEADKQQYYFNSYGLDQCYDYLTSINISEPGKGSIVAVIDTGVDINHEDLKNNIFTNKNEIPNNNRDDDQNGYIDDVNGWNFVNDNNQMYDDNGHGTHVAGIIAAEKNNFGTTGIAYNTKVMPLKAGDSSGNFLSDRITKAINYASLNGANVINMSFGSASLSLVVQDALKSAYHTSSLVAAAGNDGNDIRERRIYPACLTYVLGVMSSNEIYEESSFSNYDYDYKDKVNYEVYAPGENILSTFPNNKYTTLSGTSMAAPIVSGMAALLRQKFNDASKYPNKFFNAQIQSTANIQITPKHYQGNYKAFNFSKGVNVFQALTTLPKPEVTAIGYKIFDLKEFNPINNGNYKLDAGETVYIVPVLYNRWGMAKDIIINYSTLSKDIALTNTSINYGMLGTYSTNDYLIMDESNSTYTGFDKEKALIVKISQDAANDAFSNIKCDITFKNGLDENDTKLYNINSNFDVLTNNGVYLPKVIDKNMTLTKDRFYILSGKTFIQKGVTLTINPGTKLKFGTMPDLSGSRITDTGFFEIHGVLNAIGTPEEMINFLEPKENYGMMFTLQPSGKMLLKYSNITNPRITCFNGDIYGDPTFENRNYFTIDHCNVACPSDDGEVKYYYNKELQYGNITIQGNSNAHFKLCDSRFFYSSRISGDANDEVVRCVFDHNPTISGVSESHNTYIIDTRDRATTMTIDKDNSYLNLLVSDLDKFTVSTQQSTDTDKTTENAVYINTDNKETQDWVVNDYNDDPYLKKLVLPSNTDKEAESLWPFVIKCELFDAKNRITNTFGKELINIKLTFNRPMDSSVPLEVLFGSTMPYADYKIPGNWTGERIWEGKYNINTFIENGIQYLNIGGGAAADDKFKEVEECECRFKFEINTTKAMSQSIRGKATPDGIKLDWTQDDYSESTIMGYNVYRSSEENGISTKINREIISKEDSSFLDTNVLPGETYWYTFTIVLSNFKETNPSGKIRCSAYDSMAPDIIHNPIYQGFTEDPLTIICSATDNISIRYVKLHYRTTGESLFKTVDMNKFNDKYSYTININELTTYGIDYYIEASDGTHIKTSGTEINPHHVIIKDNFNVNHKGDVDGDGQITVIDAQMILNKINGAADLTPDQFARADLNGDGELSTFEALAILQYINGTITSLEL